MMMFRFFSKSLGDVQHFGPYSCTGQHVEQLWTIVVPQTSCSPFSHLVQLLLISLQCQVEETMNDLDNIGFDNIGFSRTPPFKYSRMPSPPAVPLTSLGT